MTKIVGQVWASVPPKRTSSFLLVLGWQLSNLQEEAKYVSFPVFFPPAVYNGRAPMLATVKQPWLQIHKPVVISIIQATQLWGEGGQTVSIGGDMQSLTQLSNSSTGVSEDRGRETENCLCVCRLNIASLSFECISWRLRWFYCHAFLKHYISLRFFSQS